MPSNETCTNVKANYYLCKYKIKNKMVVSLLIAYYTVKTVMSICYGLKQSI